MRNFRCLTAAAAVGGMMLISQTSWASPIAPSWATVGSNASIADDLMVKVHGWHCSRKKGWYKGDKVWHRHRRACQETQFYDDDDYDDYHYRRSSPGVYINPGASIRLHFGGQGDWR